MNEIKWIPVKERLPEEDGTYLITYNNFRGEKCVSTMQFSEEELNYYADCSYYIESIFKGYGVIAWAYTPAPYEED